MKNVIRFLNKKGKFNLLILLVSSCFFNTSAQNCLSIMADFGTSPTSETLPEEWSGTGGFATNETFLKDNVGYYLIAQRYLCTGGIDHPFSISFRHACSQQGCNTKLHVSYSIGSASGPFHLIQSFSSSDTDWHSRICEIPDTIKTAEKVYLKMTASARVHYLDDVKVQYNCMERLCPVMIFEQDELACWATDSCFKNPLSVYWDNQLLTIPVIYSSSNPAVATVDKNGCVTLTGVGATRISAVVPATDLYEQGEASYALNVNMPCEGVIASDTFTENSSLFTLSWDKGESSKSNYGFKSELENTDPVFIPQRGKQSLVINDGKMRLSSIHFDTDQYKDLFLTLSIGSYNVSPGNGADLDDYLRISVSADGGSTWKPQLLLKGKSNICWPLEDENELHVRYNSEGKISIVKGQAFGKIRLTDLPATENLCIQIEAYNDSDGELWVIDEFSLCGSLRFVTPAMITAQFLADKKEIALSQIWNQEAVDRLRKAFRETGFSVEKADLTQAVFLDENNLDTLFSGLENLTAVKMNRWPDHFGGFERVNPNCLIYVSNPPEILPETYSNIIWGDRAFRIELTDKYPFESPTSFVAQEISYTRYFSPDKISGYNVAAGWETIVLPFKVDRICAVDRSNADLAPFSELPFDYASGKRPFWLRLLTPEGFRAAEVLEANTPYILSMPNNDKYADRWNIWGNVVFSATEARIEPLDFTKEKGVEYDMLPTLKGESQGLSVYPINDEGSYFVADLRETKPFEAYVVSHQPLGKAPLRYGFNQDDGLMTELVDITMLADKPQIRLFVKNDILLIESENDLHLPLYHASGILLSYLSIHKGRNEVKGLSPGVYLIANKKIIL